MEVVRISKDQTVLRRYVLPCKGKVLVQIGQSVAPGEPIAEVDLPGRFQVFDVVNSLHVKPGQMDKIMKRLAGEEVKVGDVIAQKNGLFSRIFRAYEDGKVLSVREGKVTLALGERKAQVSTAIPGTIVEVIPDRGAVVSAQGALIQGAWGNGLSAAGPFQVTEIDYTKPDRNGNWPDMHGKICFLETCPRLENLRRIVNRKPAGLVFCSAMPGLVPELRGLPIPVILFSGFGDIRIDPITSEVLEVLDGQVVYSNALQREPETDSFPEVFLPKESEQVHGLFESPETLSIGSKVRLLGMPYTGSVGEVVEIPAAAEKFASGLVLQPVVVKRADEQVIRVPRENLELLVQ